MRLIEGRWVCDDATHATRIRQEIQTHCGPATVFIVELASDKLGEMSRPRSTPSPFVGRLRPRVKIWFEAAGGESFGFGLIAILQAIERAGSIKQAAADLGQSYRHVWGRVKQAERAVGQVLVETQVGGQGVQRSRLTAAARNLVADFVAIRARMIEVMEQEFAGDLPSEHAP
jgi:molybdate transport system regulatory protein